MAWNVLGCQQGKGWLFSCLYEEIIGMFRMKMSQINTKNDRIIKIFQRFYRFFSKFSTDGICQLER